VHHGGASSKGSAKKKPVLLKEWKGRGEGDKIAPAGGAVQGRKVQLRQRKPSETRGSIVTQAIQNKEEKGDEKKKERKGSCMNHSCANKTKLG